MRNLNGYTAAVYIFYKDNVASFGNIYGNERINGKLSQVYVNKDEEFVLVHGDGTVEPLVKIRNKSGYLCIRIRNKNYAVHAVMLYSFKRDSLPEDFLENKSRFNGAKDDAAYTIEHRSSRKTDNSIDNLKILTRRENRANRIFGSRNEMELKKIGNDAKYAKRDTKRLRADTINRDNKMLDDEYMEEYEDFLDNYR